MFKVPKLTHDMQWVTGKEEAPVELQEKYEKLGYANLSVSSGELSEWYCLLHKLQRAKALPEISKGEVEHLVDEGGYLPPEHKVEWR